MSSSLTILHSIAILSRMQCKGTIHVMLLSLLVLVAADSKPDSFQVKTVWQGVSDADPRWAHSKEFPVRLRVMERKGEDFAAVIALKKPGDPHTARLEGKIRSGELGAHITKILKGGWGEDATEIVWKGQIDGENLLLERTNKRNMTATIKL